jgi:transcription elongation factor GreA
MAQTIYYVSESGLVTLKNRLIKAQTELQSIRDDKAISYTATGDTWHDNPYFNKLEQEERSKEAEVADIKNQIANARLYTTENRNVERVALGSIVHLARYFKVSGQQDEQVWEVSGFGEIDVARQCVAYNAPLMQAIMGHHVGDSAESNSPQGPVEYEILALFKDWNDVPTKLKKR